MMKYKYLILFVFGLLIHACDDITDKDSPEDNEGSNTKTDRRTLIISAVKTIEDWAIPPMIWLFTAVSSIS